MNLFEGRLNREGAEPLPEDRVYWCVVCGPIIMEPLGDAYVIVHRDIPHAETMWFDEEDRPQ